MLREYDYILVLTKNFYRCRVVVSEMFMLNGANLINCISSEIQSYFIKICKVYVRTNALLLI